MGVTAKGRPLVSVVVAAHQAVRHVRSALASLSAQTVDDLEVLVVDDGSTDGTADEVAAAARADGRIRLLRLGRNRGQSVALNAGLDEARGRILALLDADDEATPDRLALQLAALGRNPDLVLVGGAVATFCDRTGASGNVWRYATGDAEIRARSLFKSEVISSAMTLDLERVRRYGLRFDEGLRIGADWALSLAAMRVGEVANVPEVVMRYRFHASQATAGMVDDVASDGTRIRLGALAWLGVLPTEAELRTHLAVSPCHYWPFGAHPYFSSRRAWIARDAARWFARLREANARTGRVPGATLGAWLDEIAALVEGHLAAPRSPPAPFCPVVFPRPCLANDPCR
jgi:glycosyltransferase involved in cell wall biosynthesis